MIEIDEKNLRAGLLGLVVSLVEIIVEALSREAFTRMRGGRLGEDEIERLGEALLDLEEALARIKSDNDIADVVLRIKESLDGLVEDVVKGFVEPAEPRVSRVPGRREESAWKN